MPANDLVRRMVDVRELGGRVRERAAAELRQADHRLELREERLELTARRLRRGLGRLREHLEHRQVERLVGRDDQAVLAAEPLVERALRDSGRPAQRVDARRGDAVLVELLGGESGDACVRSVMHVMVPIGFRAAAECV